jgi:hypothetical protein
MGLPSLPVGTHGTIGFTVDPGPPRHVRARTHFRDVDGVVRQVTKFGPSKAAGERALKLALRDRCAWAVRHLGRNQGRGPGSAVAGGAAVGSAPNTRQAYSYVLSDYVIPAVGALRVREVSTPAVDRTLSAVSTRGGPGAAKSTRSVVSGMFRLAVRHGAVAANPVTQDVYMGRNVVTAEAARLLDR